MKVCNQSITNELADSILAALPTPRRATYESEALKHGFEAERTPIAAARLYLWNGYLASVVDRTTGEVEVLLRNFMDKRLRLWNLEAGSGEAPTEAWLENPKSPLDELVFPKGKPPLKRFSHLSTVKGEPTHDDYIAGFTFGTWAHLLPKQHAGSNNTRLILWNEALLPGLDASTDRVAFQGHVMKVKQMRNRATHRRPLVKDLGIVEQIHQSCIEVTRSIDPAIGAWLKGERWIPDALKLNPLLPENGG